MYFSPQAKSSGGQKSESLHGWPSHVLEGAAQEGARGMSGVTSESYQAHHSSLKACIMSLLTGRIFQGYFMCMASYAVFPPKRFR